MEIIRRSPQVASNNNMVWEWGWWTIKMMFQITGRQKPPVSVGLSELPTRNWWSDRRAVRSDIFLSEQTRPEKVRGDRRGCGEVYQGKTRTDSQWLWGLCLARLLLRNTQREGSARIGWIWLAAASARLLWMNLMKSTRGREAASYCSERSTILKQRTEEAVGVGASDVSVASNFFSHQCINLVMVIQHCSYSIQCQLSTMPA